LRHSHGTHAFRRGAEDLATVRETLRHASLTNHRPLQDVEQAPDRKRVRVSLGRYLAASLERNYFLKATTCLCDDSERMLAYYAFSRRALAPFAHVPTSSSRTSIPSVRAPMFCKRLRNGHRRRVSCTRFSFAAAIAGDGSTVINVSAMFIDVHQQLIARNAHVPDIAKKKAA